MYKRNQVAWAIWQALDRGHRTSDEVPSEVNNMLRRLIDVDRNLSVTPRAHEAWKHCFAFVEGRPQGRGSENRYRLADVVTLWIGVQFLAAGLPQTEIIEFLRALRPQLNDAVNKIHQEYAGQINMAAKEKRESARRFRNLEFLSAKDHVYVLTQTVAHYGVLTKDTRRDQTKISNICWGREDLLEFIEAYVPRDKRLVLVEIANVVLSLAYFLAISLITKRGRPA